MTSNMLIPSSRSAGCPSDVPDLPGGKQHWSLAGTSLERNPELRSSCSVDATIYFPSIVSQAGPDGLSLDECKVLALSDAGAAFQLWRDLYRAHVPYAIDYHLWVWSRAICSVALESSHVSIPPMIRLGLCDFIHEVLCRVDLFDDVPVLADSVIGTLAATIAWAVDRAERGRDVDNMDIETLNNIVVTVCRVSWEKRRLLLPRDSLEDTSFGSMQFVRFRLQFLVALYYRQYIPHGEGNEIQAGVFLRPGHEDIRRMSLFLWFHCDDKENEMALGDPPFEGEALLFWVYNTLEQLGIDSPEIETFARSDVLSEYGALAFLKRLSLSLRLQARVPSLSSSRLKTILSILKHVTLSCTEFLAQFAPSGVLESLRYAVSRHEKMATPSQCLKAVRETLLVYHEVATRVPVANGRAFLIRQCDVAGLLALAMSCNAKTSFCETDTFRELVDDYTAFSRVLCERHSKTNTLRKALTSSTRYHWYSTLRELRASKATTRVNELKHYRALERSWVAFGEALGLDEAREAAEHEREKKRAAQSCAWKECQYHKAKPPSPPNVCKGCGEVRYCGRECQIKDWKDGHKRVCKRLKDEAHTPKK